jgi:DNA polymerase-4
VSKLKNQDRTIFHIDMNAFYASCEQVANPELKGKAIIVGGDPKRRSGIVVAASYEAKKCGVKTASTLYSALKLCPEAIIVTPNHELYSKMSKQVMAIFDDYTPLKEQLSIDEAYLDMTGTTHLFGEPFKAAKLIQQDILERLGLPSSVGIANNKLLAKMASDLKKPMGITTLYVDEIKDKLWPLPVGELYGIGRQSVPKLKRLGILTIGDLAKTNRTVLETHFTSHMANMMIEWANGYSSNQLDRDKKNTMKSIGNELTYGTDLCDMGCILKEILGLSDKVAFRLRGQHYRCRTITLKIKYSDFTVITRSKTINFPTDETNVIYQGAKELAILHAGHKPIRLIGVTVTNFEDSNNKQLSLFEEETASTKDVDLMVDKIRGKYGFEAIKKAGAMKKDHEKKQ